MELICQGQTIIIIILLIDIVLAAYPPLGNLQNNWNNIDGQSLQQQYSQSTNYYNPYSQWGINSIPQHSQYFQPSFSLNSPSSSSFRVPYAAYRNSAFASPTFTKQVDNLQKQQLSTIDESESFNSDRRKSEYFAEENGGSEDGIQRILKTVAEKLPKLAETMSKLGQKDNTPSNSQVVEEDFNKQQIIKDASTALPYFLNKREYNLNNEIKEQNSFSSSPLLFSFNKLLSAFNAGGNEQIISTTISNRIVNLNNRENSLMKASLQSEDLSPELIFQQKGVLTKKDQQQQQLKSEEKFNYIPHLTPPPELPSPQNPLNSFLQQFGISNLMPTEKSVVEVKEKKKREQENEGGGGGDLITNLMKGQLPQMPDWLNQFGFDSMFGTNNNNNNEQQKSGNALASIFGKNNKNGGGNTFTSFFGSGLDDTPRNK
ncbi:hypothetical protein Mgra_00000288 [Meloidogyne graminicola]|uniref:Uncharacterized protein n=1 Tax=Meloidogyne graminicola TaxID=189291 RepID=A0A8T0A3N2_9BILA|nr:hypothetical protein Mgra_00000288 [Meloidogyne graminicola]